MRRLILGALMLIINKIKISTAAMPAARIDSWLNDKLELPAPGPLRKYRRVVRVSLAISGFSVKTLAGLNKPIVKSSAAASPGILPAVRKRPGTRPGRE